MDDQSFDDLIKDKVGNYQAAGYEPSALADLHQKLAASSQQSFFATNRRELFTAAAVLTGVVIIVLSQWLLNDRLVSTSKQYVVTLQSQHEEIKRLTDELEKLKSLVPDTVFIEQRRDPGIDALTRQIELLESKIEKLSAVGTADEMVAGSPTADLMEEHADSSGSTRLSPHHTQFTRRATLSAGAHTKKRERLTTPLSATTMRLLEQHYRDGIGIRLGPTLELSNASYVPGSGTVDTSVGLLTELILSPSISVETGGKYVHRYYGVSGSKLTNRSMPHIDPALGTLATADIDSWMVELPLNVKYRYPLSVKTHWLGGVGYSALFYTKQMFEYNYQYDATSASFKNASYINRSFSSYAGLVNISLGLSNQMKDHKTLETSVYYQHALGSTGIEGSHPRIIGVRGVYWFKMR